MAVIGRRRAALSLALALTAVWLVVAAVQASAASAYTNSYCGVLINEWTWCGDASNHTYTYNSATYSGGGSVFVCERLLYADSPTPRSAESCGYNFVERSYGSTTSLWEAEVEHATGTGARHTISGYAYTA